MQLSSIVHHKHDEKNYIENQSRQPSLNLTSSFGAKAILIPFVAFLFTDNELLYKGNRVNA
jgi:hypothetical protein